MEIIEVNEKKEGTDIDYYNNVSNPASFSQTNNRCCHIPGHCWLCANNKGQLQEQANKKRQLHSSNNWIKRIQSKQREHCTIKRQKRAIGIRQGMQV